LEVGQREDREAEKAAICTGSHPAVRKRPSEVVIRKPGKDDNTQLKAYHSISLVSCMGKVVEKVVAELLSEGAEKRGLLSDGQFGSRKGRSAIDAAAIMVDRAHASWKSGHITGVLIMDIKAAFPSVAKGRLVNLIKDRQMDGDLIRWTSRRGLQFDPAKMEAALLTRRRGHRKDLRPNQTAKIQVRIGTIRFNRQATRWLGVWMDAHITFKEEHNRCMRNATAADARLRTVTKTYGVVPDSVRAVHVA